MKEKIVKLVALWVLQNDCSKYKAIVELQTKLIELNGPLPSSPKNVYDIHPRMGNKQEVTDNDTQNLNPTESKLLKDLETVDKISSELNRIIVEDSNNETKFKLYNVLLVSRDKISSLLNDSSGYSIIFTKKLKTINTKVNNIISKCNFKKQPIYTQTSEVRKNSNPFEFNNTNEVRKNSNPFEDKPVTGGTNPFEEFVGIGKPEGKRKSNDQGIKIQFGKRASNTGNSTNPFEGFNFPTSFKQKPMVSKQEDFLGLDDTKQKDKKEEATDFLGLNINKEDKPIDRDLEFLSIDPNEQKPQTKQDDFMNVDLI